MVDVTGERALELGAPGPLRDRLVAAVLAGEKRATSSLLLEYDEAAGEALAKAGERRALVDSSGASVAVVEAIDVRVIPLGDADLQLALEEGEGFPRSSEWREAHEAFWIEEVLPALRLPEGWSLDDDTEVVERFRLVQRLS